MARWSSKRQPPASRRSIASAGNSTSRDGRRTWSREARSARPTRAASRCHPEADVARALDISSSLRSLSARDRRTLLIGAVIAVILFVLAVILPLDSHVSRLQTAVAKKQADLVWMRRAAPEIAAAGPVRSNSGESLIVIVDQSARESGLGSSLAGSQPSGRGSLNVQLEKAPFDTLVGWLARLSQQNGVQIESATIDSAGQPGTVNASLVLKGP